MWGYKFEAMDGNVRAAQILGEAGIPVAFKSDHPVLTAVSFASCHIYNVYIVSEAYLTLS
jgi:imidazolonepropionase-like amidohydrolase